MRQPFELRSLRERPVSHVNFDRHERDAAILDDDHLEAIWQDLPLDASLQFRTLSKPWRWSRGRNQRDRQNAAP
jgi:hypothetical protein